MKGKIKSAKTKWLLYMYIGILGETASLLEKLLKMRFAVQDSIHGGIVAYLHKNYTLFYTNLVL